NTCTKSACMRMSIAARVSAMQAGGNLSDITSFAAALQSIDARELGDEELADRCMAVTALLDIVQVHAAELTAEFEQRGTWDDDGATSAAAWIASRTGRYRPELS